MEQNMQGFTNTADRDETVSYIEDGSCQADRVETAMAFAKRCHQGQTRLAEMAKCRIMMNIFLAFIIY